MNHWVAWVVKLVAGLVLSAGVVWAVSFGVADYVSEKHARGLTTAIDTLKTSVSDLNSTVTAINTNLSQQLIDLERQRADLAIQIAKEVQKLQGEQGVQSRDILYLRESMERIEKTIIQINANTKVRLTVDGGKTFETYDADEALIKFGTPANGGAYVIAPWSYNQFDPKTGTIDPQH